MDAASFSRRGTALMIRVLVLFDAMLKTDARFIFTFDMDTLRYSLYVIFMPSLYFVFYYYYNNIYLNNIYL